MMFERIVDDTCVEVDTPTNIDALGFIDDDIIFKKEKILKREGATYEIHHGTSTKYPSEYKTDKLYGTFSHGLFVDDWFEDYSHKQIEDFVETMLDYLDRERILSSVL